MLPQILQFLEDDLQRRLADVTRAFSSLKTCQNLSDLQNLDDKSADALLCPNLLHGDAAPLDTLLLMGQKLQGDGLLLTNLLGARSVEHLPENNCNPLPDVRDVGNVLTQLKYALPVVDSHFLTLTFDTLEKLNETAAELLLIHTPLPDFEPRADGKYALDLEILTLTAWKPHKSQPQPLRPGQYKVKMEDVLGTSNTGDD